MKNSILDKGHNPCCSCGVCAVICPAGAIAIDMDSDGFYRPTVDENLCRECGLCKKVCYQYLQQAEDFRLFFEDKKIYGAWSRDEQVVQRSSSGGVGYELVNYALSEGYQACGVIFNLHKEKCEHVIVSSADEANAFSGSKYLQSYTVSAFSQFEVDKKYLVVGTPCQIYALRKYVQHKGWEDNFLLIDFFCHGTPSYLLWEKYRKFLTGKYQIGELNKLIFRSKKETTWHKNKIEIEDIDGNLYSMDKAFKNDLFFKFFLSDCCLNESCYKCLFRHDYCFSDIRLADFWGYKYRNNEKGVSLVSVNTKIGNIIFEKLKGKFVSEACSFSDLQNSQKQKKIPKHKKTKDVMKLLRSALHLEEIYRKTIKVNLFDKVKRKSKKIINMLFVGNKRS